MSIFHQEVQRGKELAKGARHRKRGSKSKQCHLPHENLTKKQLADRNGKLTTYSLNQPLSWSEFKALPHDLQQEYLSYLQHTFSVATTQLSDMFGCSTQTVLNHCNNNGLTYVRMKTKRMSVEDKVAWDRFFEQEPNAIQSPITESADTTALTLPQGMGYGTSHTTSPNNMNLERFNIQFTGVTNPMEILTLLTALVGGKTGTVTVSFKAKERS